MTNNLTRREPHVPGLTCDAEPMTYKRPARPLDRVAYDFAFDGFKTVEAAFHGALRRPRLDRFIIVFLLVVAGLAAYNSSTTALAPATLRALYSASVGFTAVLALVVTLEMAKRASNPLKLTGQLALIGLGLYGLVKAGLALLG